MVRIALAFWWALASGILQGPNTVVAESRELQGLTPELEDAFMPMIVVVETGGPDKVFMELAWEAFRLDWPNRGFCILQARGGGEGTGDLLVPKAMIFDESVGYLTVNRDYNMHFRQSDWFDLCQLYQLGGNRRRLQIDQVTTVALLIDVKKGDVLSSFNFFMERTTAAGISVEMAQPRADRNFITPMNRMFVSTLSPSSMPSRSPSDRPSLLPSGSPSGLPSSRPTQAPTELPSSSPSRNPTRLPSSSPSNAPSKSNQPSDSIHPSSQPSESFQPSDSLLPSALPSNQPSLSLEPSISPSRLPSSSPSFVPSLTPSISPSRIPSTSPSAQPSRIPSQSPSSVPSRNPTSQPTTVEQFQDGLRRTFGVDVALARDSAPLRAVANSIKADMDQVIVGNLASVETITEFHRCGRAPKWIDDLWVCLDYADLVNARDYVSDDPNKGQPIAIASPGLVRNSGTPITGEIVFDWRVLYSFDIHQIGIAAFVNLLGVGTLWDNLVSGKGGCEYPASSLASQAYQALSGCPNAIPMEEGCGNFDNQCFVASRIRGDGVHINLVTAASLEDLGYKINYDALDGQTTLAASCKCRRRDMEIQRNMTQPVQRRLSAKGRKVVREIGLRYLAEREKDREMDAGQQHYEGRRAQVGEEENYMDMRAKVVAVLYREMGTYYTRIIRPTT